MSDEKDFIVEFVNKLDAHAKRKATLYDGIETANRREDDMSIDFFLRCAIEELGEVASAITRERWQLAFEECIDVAHTAMLIALAIRKNKNWG